MGVLPLQLPEGVTGQSLGLTGSERIDVQGLAGGVSVQDKVSVRFIKLDGRVIEILVTCRLDTAREIAWFEAGGVMPYVLDKFAAAGHEAGHKEKQDREPGE